MLLLTLPTKHDGRLPIHQTKPVFQKPQERLRNFRIIEQNYYQAPNYKRHATALEEIFRTPHETVADFNLASILWGLSVLFELPEKTRLAVLDDIQRELPHSDFRLKKIILFSKSHVAPPDKGRGRDANDWLVDACRAYAVDEYYFGGTGAESYMDFAKFENAGIALVQQEWCGTPYAQRWGTFLPNLSILDLLMNVPPVEAREILRTKGQ